MPVSLNRPVRFPNVARVRAENLMLLKERWGNEKFQKVLDAARRDNGNMPKSRAEAVLSLFLLKGIRPREADALCTALAVPDYEDETLALLEEAYATMQTMK